MVKVVGIRFKPVGKIYFFDPEGVEFEEGDYAVVDTARGIECGQVAQKNHEVMPCQVVGPLRKVIRKATDDDLKKVEAKLSNPKFVEKAPENIIAAEKKKQADANEKIAMLKENIQKLSN